MSESEVLAKELARITTKGDNNKALHLFDVPQEILLRLFSFVDVFDLFRLSCTNHFLNTFIQENRSRLKNLRFTQLWVLIDSERYLWFNDYLRGDNNEPDDDAPTLKSGPTTKETIWGKPMSGRVNISGHWFEYAEFKDMFRWKVIVIKPEGLKIQPKFSVPGVPDCDVMIPVPEKKSEPINLEKYDGLFKFFTANHGPFSLQTNVSSSDLLELSKILPKSVKSLRMCRRHPIPVGEQNFTKVLEAMAQVTEVKLSSNVNITRDLFDQQPIQKLTAFQDRQFFSVLDDEGLCLQQWKTAQLGHTRITGAGANSFLRQWQSGERQIKHFFFYFHMNLEPRSTEEILGGLTIAPENWLTRDRLSIKREDGSSLLIIFRRSMGSILSLQLFGSKP